MKAMNINRDNYEIYIVDFYDGTLSAPLTSELMLFLEANPDLKLEFDEYGIAALPMDAATLDSSFKNNLKKISAQPIGVINKSNVDTYLIMELEGFLSSKEQHDLNDFIVSNTAYVHDRKLYQLTRVKADTAIVFANKERLHKPLPVRRIVAWRYFASAAAVAAFIYVGIGFLYNDKPQPIQPAVAANVHTIQPKVVIKPALDATIKPAKSLAVSNKYMEVSTGGAEVIKETPPSNSAELIHVAVRTNFKAIDAAPQPTISMKPAAIVYQDPTTSIAKNTNRSLRSWVIGGINKLAGAPSLTAESEKVNWWNFAKLATNYIKDKLDSRVDLSKKETGNNETIALSIGDFEVSRSFKKD
jgi:hypothetical protein